MNYQNEKRVFRTQNIEDSYDNPIGGVVCIGVRESGLSLRQQPSGDVQPLPAA
jgi:hypothetical protein